MPSVAEELDDDRGAAEAAVDANEGVPRSGQDLLRDRAREPRRRAQFQEPSLQPAVATACDLGTLDDGEQLRDPVPPARSELDNPAVEGVLGREAVRNAESSAAVSDRPSTKRARSMSGNAVVVWMTWPAR